MDRPDSPLSEQATAILRLIADGRSYDQILMRRPDLTYQDIFAAAQEALAKLSPGQAGPRQPSVVERARQTHHRAWARWTADEDEQLERLFRRGAHLAEIGQALGRHNGSIRQRLAKLGLLPEDADDPDQLLTPGGQRSTFAEEPAPPRSSPGWDTIRRRLGGGQETG